MKRRDLLLMACGLAAADPLLQAQTAPIRILVGAPAGGTTDESVSRTSPMRSAQTEARGTITSMNVDIITAMRICTR